ncbi:MAG: class I SAM-dependent methyltransferase [Gammaproteobacteria bacterium]|nr:MAG: class I SAM-dependent methyltransferase [Gammaproteobacteria bacterium]
MVHKMLAAVDNPPIRLSLWDGREVTSPVDNPIATLQFFDRIAVLKAMFNPELYFGDLYSSGRMDFNGDMTGFFEAIYRGLASSTSRGFIHRLLLWLGRRRITNSHARARDNIHHHYDIGNDFYQLWLDNEAMQYTCAYYPDPNMSLEDAQLAKLHHICRKLQINPGDRIVEAGCGWGGLSLFMAKYYGAKVTAYNISKEQVKYARDKAEREKLSGQVEYVLDDYRNITGMYDVFVSVGMLEHVGKRDFPSMGKVINRCLAEEGRGLIHAIGRNYPRPLNAWIERRIFPGAYPPTLREMMEIFEPFRFSVLDVENLRLHYAKTLKHWMQRFEQNADDIEAQLDKAFVKAWRMYLAGSTAAFRVGELQLFQVVFTRSQNNHLPWSRAHLYSNETDSDHRHQGQWNDTSTAT